MICISHSDSRQISFDMLSPTFLQLPRFLRETKHKNIVDSARCPWHMAHQTTLGPFAWMQSHPYEFKAFVSWMTAQRKDMPTWLDVFPVEEHLCGSIQTESVLFVDIGGGPGHQCMAFKQRYPQIEGRIILQDTEDVIREALSIPGVEAMVHDFWTEQPIKGIQNSSTRAPA